MKNKYKKEMKAYFQNLFKYIKNNLIYKKIIKLNYFIRLIIWILFIIYWLIALIIPLIPWCIISTIIGILIICKDIKYVKSKFFYIINYFRIQKIILQIYQYFKIKKMKLFN